MYGGRFAAQKAKELHLITNMYKDQKEMESQIKGFATEFAPKGKFRDACKELKMNIYHNTY